MSTRKKPAGPSAATPTPPDAARPAETQAGTTASPARQAALKGVDRAAEQLRKARDRLREVERAEALRRRQQTIEAIDGAVEALPDDWDLDKVAGVLRHIASNKISHERVLAAIGAPGAPAPAAGG